MSKLLTAAVQARDAGELLPGAYENLSEWIETKFLPEWALQALQELADMEAWEEFNDRFFKKLAFGTGGMRGLTIGKIIAPTELGTPSLQGTPAHAAVGANNLNDFTLIRATMGLFRYAAQWLEETGQAGRQPRLVVAHDVRHFSRHFCELAAHVWTKMGGAAFIFDGPRSTPQLSFTVRHMQADAGIVITASHNPPPYNGYKCYFNDGAQVVPPHDQGVITQVNAVALQELPGFLTVDLSAVQKVPAEAETAYLEQLQENILDAKVFEAAQPEVVFTNIHGTGDVMILPALKKLGVPVTPVEAQRVHDPRFPTVKSPNPENAEAFTLGIAEAKKIKADLVIGTDPDDDRIGAAVREPDGSYRLLTGNTIGSLLAHYRIGKMKELGIIPAAGSPQATLIKTFVSTPLQDAIAANAGIRCVNTLTGFKWIAAKLLKYQRQVEAAVPAEKNYDALPWRERAELQLAHGRFFVFGGEESYGFLGTDAVRDKDANAAALMLVELAASLKARGLTFSEYLDEIYLQNGFFIEDLLNIVLEGAAGAAQIKAILTSLRDQPPQEVDGAAVESFQDFGRQEIKDADGDVVPKEDLYFFTLRDGRRFAVRGSGTEPKIKYYLFASAQAESAGDLSAAKERACAGLAGLGEWLGKDALRRAGL